MKTSAAFSLIEMMVTLSIASILLTVVGPGLSELYDHYRADSAIRRIQQTLQYARNSAISYGVRVTVCPIFEGKCSADWHRGLTIFIDSNTVNTIDDQDVVLFTSNPFNSQDFIVYNRLSVKFQADGLASGSNGTLKYCPSSTDSSYSRAVIINQAGRVRFSTKNDISCN